MYDSWSCLSVEKGPGVLPDQVRTALKAAACNLHLTRSDQMRIETDLISGLILTKWDTHMIGSRSGVLFRSQFDCTAGTNYLVNFLLNTADLERGAAILRELEEKGETWNRREPVPCPDLYRFEDLRRSGHYH